MVTIMRTILRSSMLAVLLGASSVWGGQPPQTGQHECHDTSGSIIVCTGTLQDGDLRPGIAWPGNRFETNPDGTITDHLTGLVWSPDSAAFGSLSWQQALDQAASLNRSVPPHRGHDDWRMPNATELASLLDAGSSPPSRTLSAAGLTLAAGSFLWSSTTDLSSPSRSIVLSFDSGIWESLSKGGSGYLLPVRGPLQDRTITLPRTGQTACYDSSGTAVDCSGTGQDGAFLKGDPWPTPRFTIQDQLATDTLTGLVWSRDANLLTQFNAAFDADGIHGDGAVTWQRALEFVASLNAVTYLGYQDWRLPSLAELSSLIDRGVSSTAEKLTGYGIDGIPADTDFFWSSTSVPTAPFQAYTVDLSANSVNASPKTTVKNHTGDRGGLVWPVRGGIYGRSAAAILPASIDFGTLRTGNGSMQRQISITNTTTSNQPLVVDSLTVTGEEGDRFTVAPGGANPCGSITPTLSPGSSCTFTVTCTPTLPGTLDGLISLVTNSSAAPLTVPLSATAVDGTPPTGTVSINGGALTTASSSVTLSLSAHDDGEVAEMRFSNDGVSFSPWVVYGPTHSWTLTPNDGTKTVYSQFRDAAGNISPTATASIFLKQPTTGEIVIAGFPSGGITNASTLVLTPTGTDLTEYRYSLSPLPVSGSITPQPATFTPVGVPIVLTDIPEGTYQLDVTGRDIAGSEQQAPTSLTITIDRTPPQLTITPSTLRSPTSVSTITLSGTVEPGVVSVALSVNDLFRGYASIAGTSWSMTIGGLSEGRNRIRVTALDPAGNSRSFEETIVYDSLPPVAQITGIPSAGSSVNGRNAFLTVSGSDLVSYRYRLDNSDYSPELPVDQPITLSDLPDGSHQVAVIGRDLAGNWQPVNGATIHQWRVDTAPVTFTVSPPTSPTNVTTQNLTISSINKNGSIITAKNEASGHAVTSQPTTTGTVSFTSFPLVPGNNHITITARDPSGNLAASSLHIICDQVPPVAAITGEITNGSTSLSPSARFQIGGTDVVSYRYRVDAGEFSSTPADISQPLVLTSLAQGPHTLSVIGIDAAGNVQLAPTTLSWTVDSIPPAVTLSGGPSSNTTARDAGFSVSGAVRYKYALDTGAYGPETDVNTPISLTGLADGPHTLFVIGQDENGNWQKTPTTFTWIIQTTPPAVTIDPLPSPTKSTRLTGTVQAGSAVSITLRNLTDGTQSTGSAAVTGSTWNYTFSATTGKTYRVTATATSPAGTIASTSIDFLFDSTPPSLTISPLPAPLPGTTTPIGTQHAVFTISASEPLAGYTWKLDSGPVSDTIPASRPLILSNVPAGPHTLTVTGTDMAGNSGVKSVTWSVDPTLVPTAAVTPSPPPFTNAAATSLSITGASSYRISVVSSPAGAVITPGSNVTTSATAPVTVDPMPEGTYILSIFGSVDDGATWQEYPTTVAWVVDRTRPSRTTLTGTPPHSNATTVNLTASGEELSLFRYRILSAPPGVISTPSQDNDLAVDDIITLSSLPEGTYTIAVNGRDPAGNWQVDPLPGWENDPAAGIVTFVIDRTSPSISIDPPSTPTNTISQTISGTIDDPSAVISVKTNTSATGGTASSSGGRWSFPLKGLARGANLITVTARDPAGNVGTTSTTITLSTDLPLAVVSGVPESVTNVTSASITVTGANGVVDYRFSLDGAPFTADTPIANRIELSSLSEGPHSLEILGRDISGNRQEAPTSVTWVIDTTPPTVIISPSSLTSPTNAVTARFVVGGDDVVFYRYSLDNSPFSSDRTVSAPVSLENLSRGNHTLSVIGRDPAGNWQTVPTTVTWTVETLDPVLTIAPESLSTPLTDPSVNLTGTVQTPSAAVSIESVTITNSGTGSTVTATVTGATWSVAALPLTEGTNPIVVTARDSAGNSSSLGFSLTRNTTPPLTAVLAGLPAPQTTSRTAQIVVGGSDVKTYRYRLDIDGVTGSWSDILPISRGIEFTSLADARYDLHLIGRDSAGNWQPEESATVATWTVDTLPPRISIDRVTTPTRLTSQRLTGTVEPGASVSISTDRGSAGGTATLTGGTWSFIITGLASGSNRITATATDPAGNISTATTLIEVDTTPPTAVVSGLPTGTTRSSTAVGIVSGEGVVSYTWAIDGGAYSSPLSVSTPITLSGLSDGPHTISVIGRSASSLAQPVPTTASWTVDTTPPTARLSGAPADVTSTTTARITVGGADVVAYRYEFDGSPLSIELPTEVPITLSSLADGEHRLSVYGLDASGNIQTIPTPATWTVDTLPPSLSINPIIERTILSSQTISGSVEQGANIQIQVSTDAIVTQPTRAGTAWSSAISSLAMGENLITVTATDLAGNRSVQTVRIIRYTPPFVSLSNLPDGPVSGSDFAITVSGTGVVAYKYSLDGSAYSQETETGVPLLLHGLSEGIHTLRVIGRDSANTWQTYPTEAVITVDRTPPPGVDMSGAPASPTNRTFVTLTISGADVATYSWQLDDGAWSDFTSPVGIPLSLTGLQDGEHRLRIRGRDQAGNIQVVPTTLIWTVDTTPPVTTPSRPAGVYDSAFDLALVPNESALIRYTLDGTTPGDDSPLYTAPIRLSRDTTVEYRAADPAGNVETVRTETYTFAANGDVNGDGFIDILDILRALELTTGLAEPKEGERRRLDVAPMDRTMKPSPDGIIDIRDVILITRRAFGLIRW